MRKVTWHICHNPMWQNWSSCLALYIPNSKRKGIDNFDRNHSLIQTRSILWNSREFPDNISSPISKAIFLGELPPLPPEKTTWARIFSIVHHGAQQHFHFTPTRSKKWLSAIIIFIYSSLYLMFLIFCISISAHFLLHIVTNIAIA